jgi:hypothetical protein
VSQPVPVWRGEVDAQGVLKMFSRSAFLTYAKRFAGHEVELTIRKRRSQRSLKQNNYWHDVPFPMFAEHWGVSIEDAKLLLLGECFGWHEVGGHRLPVRTSTSGLDTKEGAEFTEWMVLWGASHWNLRIPLPREVAA